KLALPGSACSRAAHVRGEGTTPRATSVASESRGHHRRRSYSSRAPNKSSGLVSASNSAIRITAGSEMLVRLRTRPEEPVVGAGESPAGDLPVAAEVAERPVVGAEPRAPHTEGGRRARLRPWWYALEPTRGAGSIARLGQLREGFM
ncbi:unnamed protein product, partial [Pylaiella littoralis]